MQPEPSRPVLPKVYGIPEDMTGSVSWDWAKERLTNSHNYLITTVRPNGRPHTMIVWGIWLDDAYYFSTGATTRKAKNLATNPHCVVCNENVAEAVIVEGQAHQLDVAEIPEPAFDLYFKKYGWKLDPKMGPVFKVSPNVVFAMPEKLFPAGATRWLFDQ
jgi:nitroimidazol reductase NimA-like FMN-containing flavoprotein (pyridoxamine 5'-phosphate oxidase superfamily)